MRRVKLRVAAKSERYPRFDVYTDAATKSQIIAAVTFGRGDFISMRAMQFALRSKAVGEWGIPPIPILTFMGRECWP